ncbi:MAG: formylglycine-generating enzyme family protein [Cyanobacteria bacterium P01_D01_bin.36]
MALTLRRTAATAPYYIEFLVNVDGAIPLQMLQIPAGTFLMGSPESEPNREDDEGPQHEVSVPSFFMSRYPITQSQWRHVASLPKVTIPLEAAPGKFTGSDLPVEQVSWYEATEFCARLAEHTKLPYRLPSEAEWEYACRAGTTTPFHFGDTLTTEVANYDGNYTYADGPKGEYREKKTPVNEFDIANAFGLCDMHGNVLEWCEDYWHDSYDNAPTDGSAWLTEDKDARRVIRGGSWDDFPRYCRSAYRDYTSPDSRSYIVGFRVCC